MLIRLPRPLQVSRCPPSPRHPSPTSTLLIKGALPSADQRCKNLPPPPPPFNPPSLSPRRLIENMFCGKDPQRACQREARLGGGGAGASGEERKEKTLVFANAKAVTRLMSRKPGGGARGSSQQSGPGPESLGGFLREDSLAPPCLAGDVIKRLFITAIATHQLRLPRLSRSPRGAVVHLLMRLADRRTSSRLLPVNLQKASEKLASDNLFVNYHSSGYGKKKVLDCAGRV